MPEEKKIRVLAAKPGLDGHDRGIKVICAALRDAGMEVIYTGLRQTPEQIVAAALQEDADVIAMSVLSGAHNYLFPRVMELVKEKGIQDVLVMGGGIIPDEDIPGLEAGGDRRHLHPGHRHRRHHQLHPGTRPEKLTGGRGPAAGKVNRTWLYRKNVESPLKSPFSTGGL